MRSSARRLASGLFLVWFAVFGLTRGILGVCPEHAGGHSGGAGTALVHEVAPAAPHVHAGMEHAGMHHASSQDVAGEDDDTKTPAPHGCDCRGECCCCATPHSDLGVGDVFTVDASIAMPRRHATTADRPIIRLHFTLPLATAPPVTLTA